MSLFAPYTLVFASGLRCASYILEGQLALTGRAFIHISSVDSRHDGTNRPCAQVPPQSSFTRAQVVWRSLLLDAKFAMSR